MACDIARMNRRVQLQRIRADAVPDASGHVDLRANATWETFASRWAAVTTRGGNETTQNNAVRGTVTYTLEMHSDGVTRSLHPANRIVLDGCVLQITAAYDVDANRQTVRVDAAEVV